MGAVTGQPTDSLKAPVRRHYRRPPVVEAIIGIGLTWPKRFRVRDLENALSDEVDRYSDKQIAIQIAATASVGQDPAKPGVPAVKGTMAQQENGYRWIDKSGGSVVAIMQERFVFSKMSPYTNWEDVSAEA